MRELRNQKLDPLSGEQLDKAIAHLQKHWKPEKSKCPVCDHDAWQVDGVFELREFDNGSLNLRGRIYPVIVVACKTCGYSFWLNAVKAGVLEPEA
jgi:predicted nucleic-acid-binding Zn-ribbon protein